MRRVIETDEVSGLAALLGERVTLWCECYIYAGVLSGVNEDHAELTEAVIVYETGPLSTHGFKDAQSLPSTWYVRTAKIESYGVMS